jgi:hypothetical protein
MTNKNEFKCDPCNYETGRLLNFNRHKNSKKHIEKIKQQTNNSNDTVSTPQTHIKNVKEAPEEIPKHKQIVISRQYLCNYCKNEFSNSSSLARHVKACYKKEIDSKEKDKEITIIKKENSILKREIKLLKEQLQESKEDKSSFKTIAENTAEATKEATKLSSSALAFVTKHYKNAPAIKTFTNFELLLENDPDFSIAEVAIHHFKKKDLQKFIGDLLIREYKMEDPKDQSMWNTDPTRGAYIVCESVDGDSVEWYTDKGGIKISKYTVSPILEHIKEDIERYMEDSKKLLLEDTTNTVLKDMIAAQSVIFEIDNGELNKQIIKYIASYFHLDKKVIKLLK